MQSASFDSFEAPGASGHDDHYGDGLHRPGRYEGGRLQTDTQFDYYGKYQSGRAQSNYGNGLLSARAFAQGDATGKAAPDISGGAGARPPGYEAKANVLPHMVSAKGSPVSPYSATTYGYHFSQAAAADPAAARAGAGVGACGGGGYGGAAEREAGSSLISDRQFVHNAAPMGSNAQPVRHGDFGKARAHAGMHMGAAGAHAASWPQAVGPAGAAAGARYGGGGGDGAERSLDHPSLASPNEPLDMTCSRCQGGACMFVPAGEQRACCRNCPEEVLARTAPRAGPA
jgi:hypothetical protein